MGHLQRLTGAPDSMSDSGSARDWFPGALKRGLLWLLFLGPFFFLSYGFANQQTAATANVASFYFAWEQHIPFLPWTILPYWSIDLLYGLAFLCCRDKAASKRLGLRLLSAQLLCVTCFLLWPLRFAFARPAVDGIAGTLFDVLAGFDLPYNQAPSLHITLLIIIWRQFVTLPAPRPVRVLIHVWALLIGISALTTWQHHFIDVPTGVAAGLFCLWLWPEMGTTPLRKGASTRPALALRYFAGALLVLCVALALGGLGLLLAWVALALVLVAFNYAWAGAAGFQKRAGRHTLAAHWLFAPYTFGAWSNARLWTWRHPAPVQIADGVLLGRLPTQREFAAWASKHGSKVALIDLTAELPAPVLPVGAIYENIPCLDLAPIPAETLAKAALRIEQVQNGADKVWVACALGYGRSAAAVAAWLYQSGRAASAEAAATLLRRARSRVVLDARDIARIGTLPCLSEHGEMAKNRPGV
jgi:membrane-associated phospholipid phosphatase